MKLKILIIGLLAIASLKSFAQHIEYAYDAAGNRYTRQVIGASKFTRENAQAKSSDDIINNSEQTNPEVFEGLMAEKQLRIYPNPTRGKLTIEIVNYNLEDNGGIQVFDIAGRLVKNITMLSESMELDITNEPAGAYIMVIVIDNQKSEWKIIKQ